MPQNRDRGRGWRQPPRPRVERPWLDSPAAVIGGIIGGLIGAVFGAEGTVAGATTGGAIGTKVDESRRASPRYDDEDEYDE